MKERGFTLIEVLVALGMVAITLIAGLSASMALTRSTERLPETMLAQVCANNALAQMRLAPQLPPLGDSAATCLQAGHQFDVTLSVVQAANPDFRQVHAQIYRQNLRLLKLSTVVGRY